MYEILIPESHSCLIYLNIRIRIVRWFFLQIGSLEKWLDGRVQRLFGIFFFERVTIGKNVDHVQIYDNKKHLFLKSHSRVYKWAVDLIFFLLASIFLICWAEKIKYDSSSTSNFNAYNILLDCLRLIHKDLLFINFYYNNYDTCLFT